MMKWVPAFLCASVLFAPPVWAASPVSSPADPVAQAISEVLREQGIEEAKAAELAQRIVDRLEATTAASGPRLQEKEKPAVPSEWDDALAAERKRKDDQAAADRVSAGKEKAYPENVANFVAEETEDIPRVVILKHLRKIEEDGFMSDEIATDAYWRRVFTDDGYGDVYDASRELLKKALRAGLKPYKEGKGLNAKLFARLASQALQPAAPLASATTDLLHQ